MASVVQNAFFAVKRWKTGKIAAAAGAGLARQSSAAGLGGARSGAEIIQ
jgi:hypothetical protein